MHWERRRFEKLSGKFQYRTLNSILFSFLSMISFLFGTISESLDDPNEEALHIRKAVQLAQTTYSDRFTLPDVQVNTTHHQAPQTRRSRLGRALYNMIHCQDVDPIEEESEEKERNRDRSKKKKKKAEEYAKAKLDLKRRIFGNDDDDEEEKEEEDDDSHTEDEEEFIKPKKLKIKHEIVEDDDVKLERQRRLKRKIFGEEEDEKESEEQEQVQVFKSHKSMERQGESSGSRLRKALFGDDDDGFRKKPLGEEEEEDDSHTEDEEEESFVKPQIKNQSQSFGHSRPQKQQNKSEIARRNFRRKFLGEDDSHTEDEEEDEVVQSKPFISQKRILPLNKKKSALYKHLHPDEEDDEEEEDASTTFSLVNTPKASFHNPRSISAPKNQNSVISRTSTSSSFKQPPSRQTRPQVNHSSSSSISNQDIEYIPSSKGFKQKRDDSGLAGVASDSSNLKREGRVEEGSSKRQRISSQVSNRIEC